MTSSQTGHRLDDFLKLEKLGEGTYGVVFKVLIATSFLLNPQSSSLLPEFCDRFARGGTRGLTRSWP